jgi:hypothetical protein
MVIPDAAAALVRIEQVRSRLRMPWWSLFYDAAAQPAFVVTCHAVAAHLLAAPLDQGERELRWNAFGDAAIADVFVLADDTTIGFSVDDAVAELYVRTPGKGIASIIDRFRGALGGTPWERQFPEDLVEAPPQFGTLTLVAGDTNVRLAMVELHQAIARIDFSHRSAAQATVRDSRNIAAAIRDVVAWQAALQEVFGDDPIPITYRHHAAIRASLRFALRATTPSFDTRPLRLLDNAFGAIDDWYVASDRAMYERGRNQIAQAFASKDADAVTVLRVLARTDAPDGLGERDADVRERVRLFLGD